MIEIIKNSIISKLNDELDEYNASLNRLKEMEEKIINDNSEKEYQEKLKNLKKSYGFRKVFNRQLKKQYKQELEQINEEYEENLKDFKLFYDEYESLKTMLSKWNIYKVKKQLDDIPSYTKLKEFKLSYEEIVNILKDNGIYDKLTKEEKDELSKLSKKKN